MSTGMIKFVGFDEATQAAEIRFDRHATVYVRQAIAAYYMRKYQDQAVISGYHQAAKNLRKQGVPIEIALLILLGAA